MTNEQTEEMLDLLSRIAAALEVSARAVEPTYLVHCFDRFVEKFQGLAVRIDSRVRHDYATLVPAM